MQQHQDLLKSSEPVTTWLLGFTQPLTAGELILTLLRCFQQPRGLAADTLPECCRTH